MKMEKNVARHFKQFSPSIRKQLLELRQTIRKAAPKATEKMSYGVPTFFYFGNLVHYSAFKSHIGFFPGSRGVKAFKKELASYSHSVGTIKFPLDKPLPKSLVTRIVKFRAKQNVQLPAIGAPAARALAAIKVYDLLGLTRVSEDKLKSLHGFGPKALKTIKTHLRKHGLALRKA